ncbi:MAG TPA: type II secretion system protein N [Burkholderiales bacterium]|nr:type II secretion system protein N [Burkholderiales bacterium]
MTTPSNAASPSLSPDQLLNKLISSKWLPLAANIAAFILLVYALAQWTWYLLDSPAPSLGPAHSIESHQPVKLDVQPLLAARLFGDVQVSPRNVDPNQLPLSNLNLVLTGVMARGASSFAFLSVDGAPEIFLTIGQEVTAGAMLEAVYPDRVLLRRGANLESVLLKGSDAAALAPGSIAIAERGAVRSLGGGNFKVDRQALNKSLTPETLAQAAVAPGANGLAVRSIQPGSIFENLGLQTGDVIRYLNGQPVYNIEQAMLAYTEAMQSGDAGDISVEIIRGGKIEVLTYQTQRDP